MRYEKTKDRLLISVAELVGIARARSLFFLHQDEDEHTGVAAKREERLRLTGNAEPVNLAYDCESDGVRYTVIAEADAIEENTVTIIHRVATRPNRPSKETVAQARGIAYCAMYMAQRIKEHGEPCRLRILYVSDDCPTPHVVEETPREGAAESFFKKLLHETAVYAEPEIDRVCRRLPTLAAARFPYSETRTGQRELMETVYSALRRAKRLYACAPTGIGKTVSVLYPALRAIGQGHCDKVFYLTPKNTAAQAAVDGLEKLAAAGACLRAICLIAKDVICPANRVCRDGGKCDYSPNAPIREDAAARELLALEKTVMKKEDILFVAQKYKVCPYELSLRYSMYCDVIVCDYNYLFDPRIALKRYFSHHGRFSFLIDEAHNLVERAREIYGTSLSLSQLTALIPVIGELADLRGALLKFQTYFEQTLRRILRPEIRVDVKGEKHAFSSSQELPEGYYASLCELVYAFADALEKQRLPHERQMILRKAYYDLRNMLDKLSVYNERFITFMTYEAGDFTLRTLCLDPAEVIDARLSLGDGAVLFSATLIPLSYYSEVLGGRRDSMTLDVPSPFDESNLCVAVMDKMSTRYLERQDTLRAVVRAILTAVKSKPGNYMVFCPSYHYMNLLHDVLHKAVPKLETLVQGVHMSREERASFLARFDDHPKAALVGFCVMGGIYSEGIDLTGKRLIGAVVVGVGLPALCDEREAIRAYFDEKSESGRAYAYVYPGMNRVLQAAGRVIRTEEDRGVVLLIDDRFGEAEYRPLIPAHWRGLHYVGDGQALTKLLDRFWHGEGKTKK